MQTDVYKALVAEKLYCSLHVKELKVTTTELERQAWDYSKKTTKQLLDWAVTGRLLDSYWKDENTAHLTKETRKTRTAKNARSKCDLLGRLTNETDKQEGQSRQDRKRPVKACTNHVLIHIRRLDNGCASIRVVTWLVGTGYK